MKRLALTLSALLLTTDVSAQTSKAQWNTVRTTNLRGIELFVLPFDAFHRREMDAYKYLIEAMKKAGIPLTVARNGGGDGFTEVIDAYKGTKPFLEIDFAAEEKSDFKTWGTYINRIDVRGPAGGTPATVTWYSATSVGATSYSKLDTDALNDFKALIDQFIADYKWANR